MIRVKAMECEQVREKFSSLLEGDLDPQEEKTLKKHLASCSSCGKDFEAFKKTMNWLHSVGEVEAPEGFLAEIYQKMEEQKKTESRHGWVHRLSRMNLPLQAVAMVAIVFAALYVTKMIPMETRREKDVDIARVPQSEVKTDTDLAQKEVKKRKQEIALLSKAPQTKEMEQEKILPPEGKEIEKVAVQEDSKETRDSVAPLPKAEAPQMKDVERAGRPIYETEKIEKGVTQERRSSLAARPSQEIILRVSDREKALAQLRGLVEEFGGKFVREEGHILLASLSTASYPEFEKRLEEMGSPQKAKPAAPQQVTPRDFRTSPGAKEEESVGKGREKEVGRVMADQAGRITVRIRLIQE